MLKLRRRYEVRNVKRIPNLIDQGLASWRQLKLLTKGDAEVRVQHRGPSSGYQLGADVLSGEILTIKE